jgi:ADP-ribosyl-[dinitrogen reductase] hydrolase
MLRTSNSHPIQIAAVSAGGRYGRIGITFCPGKHQDSALTGAWARDLAADIGAIEQWGAAAVVTLVEDQELAALKVSGIGDEVRKRRMAWLHLPIRDVCVQGQDFERQWLTAGESLRALLRSGFDIVVHCKGGLGRAGTVAARLLVELGTAPEAAMELVREVRPGAIETLAQEEQVLAALAIPEPRPSSDPPAVRDRALGALMGLAVGDALGTTLEFKPRDSYPPLTDIVGGGPFRLKAGQWTDDTAMALALADSLLTDATLDSKDLMTRFWSWRQDGTYSCTGSCFDIGATVSGALRRWRETGNPVAGSTNPMTAGNGALMRLAPVALRWWHDRQMMREVALRQSATTHRAPEALSASAALAEILADAIEGRPRSTVLRPRDEGYAGKIAATMAGSWRGKRRNQVGSSGYVAHSLEAALWCVGRTASFREAVLLAANLGGDADTTAAITGQLAGALYGLSGIPAEWLSRVAWQAEIEETGLALIRGSESAAAQ